MAQFPQPIPVYSAKSAPPKNISGFHILEGPDGQRDNATKRIVLTLYGGNAQE
jgi:hypothetical protein